jgi:hypothetical protein
MLGSGISSKSNKILSFKILLMLLDIVNLNIYMFLKLVDGRKDAPRFIMIKSKLSQQMIVFRTDFIETVPTIER